VLIDASEPPPDPTTAKLQLQSQPNVWTIEDLRPALDQVRAERDFEIGKAAFEAVSCSTCHKLGSFQGNVSLGPDLDTAASRYSALDLLESIIEPSKVVSDQHLLQIIRTRNGEWFQGDIVEETDEQVRIRQNPASTYTDDVDKHDIVLRKASTVSRMPTGLLDPLTRGQVLDLLAYVLAAGNPDDPCFSRSGE
jgi:putative heme-binding domain-containing protein